MRFGRGPLSLLFGGCGCLTFLVVFMFLMALMSGGLEEILEEIFYFLR